jgi:hypothetical protein
MGSGEVALGWTTDGVMLTDDGRDDVWDFAAVPDGTGGAIVCWDQGGTLPPRRAQRIRGDGMVGPLMDRTTQVLQLIGPFPEPFTTSVSCDLLLARPAVTNAEIVDLAGRRVATLLRQQRLSAGPHRFQWNGKDSEGVVASPGIYFLQVRTSDGLRSARLIKIR